MDRFDTMLAFTRVVELNSFTQAAASLNLPKATLSAQVSALEKRLRVKLLNRTTRHVSVTQDGAAYYERAVRLLSDLEETEAIVNQAAMTPKGRLRVDVPGTIGRQLVVPALGDFFTRYPDIDLELGCTDRPTELLAEGIDCVIRGGSVLDESLVARRLGSIQMVTCASPTYLARNGVPATLADMDNHMLVNFFSSRTGKVRPFEYIDNGVRTVVTGQRRVSLNDLDALLAAAISGLGIIKAPSFIVKDCVAQGLLKPVLTGYETDSVPLFLLYPQNRHLSTKVRAFVEWAAELFVTSEYLRPVVEHDIHCDGRVGETHA